MDFSEYFESINLNQGDLDFNYSDHQFINKIELYEGQDISNFNIAIIGVGEERNSNNLGCSTAPNHIRKYLYRLTGFDTTTRIIDLGNLKTGSTIEDTYFALTAILEHLIKQNVLPIIIGGSQDLTYANFLAYKKLEQTVNLVSVDSKFDLGEEANEELSSDNFLTKILLQQPNYLFNYSNIGYQSYFANKEHTELLSKLYFDTYRLGQVQNNIEEVEPIVRNADILSFDISAIRQSEAPGNKNTSPNGFYGEQACQITRYAGMSDKLTSIGFYEINPELDTNGQTAHSVAQMIWYFIDGYNNRKNDFPIGSRKTYLKYMVNMQDGENEVVFYKSDKSERWWMDVPYPSHSKIKFERHVLVPCSYNDYKTACENEVPNRWWQTFQKLS